jgi:ribosome-binding ATPase YchF (GTP1/OBG family)
VIHVANKVDPLSDIEVINTELALADLAAVGKHLVQERQAGEDRRRQGSAAPGRVLEKAEAALDQGKPVRSVDWSKEELVVLKPLFLLTMKPTMYVANVAENGFKDNPLLAASKRTRRRRMRPWWQSAPLESQIADMSDEDKKLFLADMGI